MRETHIFHMVVCLSEPRHQFLESVFIDAALEIFRSVNGWTRYTLSHVHLIEHKAAARLLERIQKEIEERKMNETR